MYGGVDADADAEQPTGCHLIPVAGDHIGHDERDGRGQEHSEQDGQLLARMPPARLLVHPGTVSTRQAG